MSRVQIRQNAALQGQRGGRRGQAGWPAPLYGAGWSTEAQNYVMIRKLIGNFLGYNHACRTKTKLKKINGVEFSR